MILSFELTMPGIGSWNGKWSGSGKLYAKVVNLGRGKEATTQGTEILENQPYSYHWNDGWSARIRVYKVDAAGAKKVRKASRGHGFCGYEWMVDSILVNGRIIAPGEGVECGYVEIHC